MKIALINENRLAGLRRWERQPLSACAQGAVSYG